MKKCTQQNFTKSEEAFVQKKRVGKAARCLLGILLVLISTKGTAQTLTTDVVNTPLCPSLPFAIPYTAIGAYIGGNTFIAELSDASGSFANPVVVGVMPSIFSGVILATLPVNTTAGSAYRVRVISTAPPVTGTLNSNGNISVNASPSPPIINSITQPSCASSTASVDLGGLPASGSWTVTGAPSGTLTGTGTTGTVSGLNANATYGFTVTNSNGCISEASANAVVAAQPTSVTSAASGANAYIPNQSAGTVSVIYLPTATAIATILVGTSPTGVAISPDSSTVFVTNSGSNTVSVINTNSNTVTATIAVGATPQGIAVSPDGSKIYVANQSAGTVSVITTATNTVSATITVGTAPMGVLVTPDGSKVYVANFIDNTVSVIATATNTVSVTIPVISHPFGLSVTPDGSKVYAANNGGAIVSVIATATNTISANIIVGAGPVGVSVAPDGSKVYVANSTDGTVSVISTATNTISATITVGAGPFGLSVTPDGSKVYVCNTAANTVSAITTVNNAVSATISGFGSPHALGNFIGTPLPQQNAYIANYNANTVSVVNLYANVITATIPVGVEPIGVSVSPDASKVYIANSGSSTVSVISTATNTVAATIGVGSTPSAIVVSPDGSKVYVTSQITSGTVSVINTSTNTVSATIPVGSRPDGISITPDGSKVYVANFDDGTASVINTTTNTVSATVTVGSNPFQVAISPDGSKVYYVLGTNAVRAMYTATNTSIALIPVVSTPAGISVSHDGSKVYVANYNNSTLSVIDTVTNTVSVAIPVGLHPYGVSVSPDGSKVIVTNSGSFNASVINTATNTVTATFGGLSTPYSTGNFIAGTLSIPCICPDVPVLSASSTVNCGTVSTTLYIADGFLNGSSNWQWYSGSCGGISIGSGTSLIVSPTVTTTYYARGEGGCATAGVCNSITITVNSLQNWYLDFDNDGYYIAGPILSCSSPGAGYNTTASISGDCDDANAGINAGQAPTIVCPGDIVVGSSSGCDAVNFSISATGSCSMATDTFIYSGGAQTWVVPAGVTSIIAEVRGAQGGGSGANGGLMKAVLSVTPGQTLQVFVGGQGLAPSNGFNGGGNGGTRGGGASDIRTGGGTLNDRIIVAGGGGGHTDLGACVPGSGGGLSGDTSSCGVPGGTQTAGGGNGSFGFGGSSIGSHSGGGGGGWYGGGGSTGTTSGGGGSGYIVPTGNPIQIQNGIQGGNGMVIISRFTGTLNQIAGLPSGSIFPSGTTVNRFVATDGFGNTDTCTFNVINNIVLLTWYQDFDTDGYGNNAMTLSACTQPIGYVADNTDCNDNNILIHTGAAEITCNGIDENCNGMTDDIANPSSPATSATSNAAFNEICTGASVNLTANGGTLGTGANWKWYSGNCSTGTFVNTGTSISVSPTSTTTYFVRAESACDTTTCVQITITVKTTAPAGNVVVPPINNLPAYACNGTAVSNINVPAVSGASQYIWDGPAGCSFNSSGNPYTSSTPSVNITFGAPNGSGYYIGVQAGNACGTGTRKVQWVRSTVGVPAAVSGNTIACPNSSGNYSTTAVTGATSYLWTITGDATVVGTGLNAIVNFGPSFTSGTLCVAAQTSCYTSPTKCITISKSAPVVPGITGAVTVCIGQTIQYCVAAQQGVSSYAWTLPPNTSGSSTTNCISVTFNTGYIGGNLTVVSTNICGEASAPRTMSLKSGVPPTPAFITGPLTGLCGQTIVYSCPSQSGVTYTWNSSAATINSGQGTNGISATYGTFTSSTLCVTASNSCGASTPRCITVSGAPAAPASITATPSTWCSNASGITFDADVSNLTGSYMLSWLYPNPSVATYVLGGGNSTQLILDWITGSGPVNVTASNACGNQTRTTTWANSCRETGEEVLTQSNGLNVYPNPSSGIITIEFNSEVNGSTVITVQDMTGRIIATEQLATTVGTNKTWLDLSKSARGIYLLDVKTQSSNNKVKVTLE